jgi:hypothetical protein
MSDVVRKVRFTTRLGLAFWSVKRCLIASRTSEELKVTDPDSRLSLTCVAVSTSSSRFGSLTTVAKSSIDPPGVRVRAGFDSGRGELWSPERHRRARCRKPAGLFLSANHASSCWYLCWYRQQYKKSLLSIQLVMVLGDCRPGAPRFALWASRGTATQDRRARRVRRSLSAARTKTDNPASAATRGTFPPMFIRSPRPCRRAPNNEGILTNCAYSGGASDSARAFYVRFVHRPG